MKAITEYTPQEYSKMHQKREALCEAIKGVPLDELLASTVERGYACYRFTGVYTPYLVELLGRHPDADEIIMLVDGGFSHFGASCTVNNDSQQFHGFVYVD